MNDLSRSPVATQPDIGQAIEAVRASGVFLNGMETMMLERELATFLGGMVCHGVSSGSAALELALLALKCGPGDSIVAAPNAGGYASLAAARVGCTVRLADVDPATHLVTSSTVAAALNDDVKAVVVTHLYGNVSEVEEILSVCQPRGIAVVEDCAQALGAHLRTGQRAGSLGQVSAFSFYPTKNLGAMGDAGVIASRDPELLERIRRLRQYGWDSRYHIVEPLGLNARIDEVQAAIIRRALPSIDVQNMKRRQIVRLYSDALVGSSVRVVTSVDEHAAAHLAVLEFPDSRRMSIFRDKLAQVGVATDVHYPIRDDQQRGLDGVIIDAVLPTARQVTGRICSVPCFPEMTQLEVEFVANSLAVCARSLGT